MANKEYDGFPKHFHKEGSPNRVANTPADEVNLVARGYKASETKAAQKVADESAGGSTDSATDKPNTTKPAAKPTDPKN